MQDIHIYVAIPLLDELENIRSLLQRLSLQTNKNFTVYFCINQPDNWWDNNDKVDVCKRNIESIRIINEYRKTSNFPIEIIDKSSKGNGWTNKKNGVGWARKTIIDDINSISRDEDIIISLDGDTDFSKHYFQSIIDNFALNSKIDTISIPYYHPLNKNNKANMAILRYEIYMRVYLLNLFRISSPYSFTALGSAIAFKVKALRKIGGFTPKKSGEDFYFLQKMVKYKPIGIYNAESVRPAARFSDRVFFGTGPAMIKGNEGDWSSYPIYPMHLFENIKSFYSLIPELFISDIDTPIDNFLNHISIDKNQLWEKLRRNNKDIKHFTKAIHDYFDGLRILQYLKWSNKNGNDDNNLVDFIKLLSKNRNCKIDIKNFSFEKSSIHQLNEIRDYLCKIENTERKRFNFYNGK